MANVAPLLPGDPGRLGDYRLIGRIGQGGQGTVYLAQPSAGEPVAVKLLRAEWTRDTLARSRFAREVAAAERVAPFCTARILDARLDGDEPFVVSEFIDGPSLQAVVATDGPLTGSALDRLAVSTATALSAIHQAGVIHRDLKPGNVLIGPDGARVIDFGIARSADAAATITSQVFGTPGYIAPEVVRGEPAGPAADVFAWGATITFAATGTSPFHAPNMAAIVHRLTSGEPDLGMLTGYLRGIVADCLAKDPAARPTAVDLLMRLLHHSGRDVAAAVPVVGRAAPLPTAPPVVGPAAPLQTAALGAAAVIAPPRQAGPGGRPSSGSTPPGPTPPPDQIGYQAPQPGPGATRGVRSGHPGAWAAAIVVLVVLGVLGSLLVPRLIAGPPSGDAPGSSSPALSPATRGHSGPGRAPGAAPRTSPAAAGPANAIPARFAGTWTGAAVQANGVVRGWAATLVLPAGATSGRFTITTIPCFATVTVTDTTKTRIVLAETVTANPSGQCAASGVISLDRTGLLRARLVWRDAADPGNTAVGTFIRS
jgi:predicted Ser/Thr protein kinase